MSLVSRLGPASGGIELNSQPKSTVVIGGMCLIGIPGWSKGRGDGMH
jgi:hypothetical protein